MPRFLFASLYGLTLRSARVVYRTPVFRPQVFRTEAGTPWYRYVGYRNNMPQVEWAGRTQFLTLPQDLNNRWTGAGPDGQGRQGLYLSQEFVNDGDPFPELSHYQSGPDEGSIQIPYYEYHPGSSPVISPTLRVVEARNLRSMFLFTVTEGQSGLDLRLRPSSRLNPLVEAIHRAMTQDPEYEKIRAETRGTYDIADLDSLYQHPDGADFCRAVGNAALEIPDVRHLWVTSVRDGLSTNVVARTEVRLDSDPPRQLDYVKPEGRSTFFVSVDGICGNGVFTIGDMVYNASFESPTSPPPQLPEVQSFKDTLVGAQQVAIDELSTRVEEELETRPASPSMDKVVEKLEVVQEKLTGDEYGETVTAIDELRTAVTAAAKDPATVGEFRASLELSTGVADTMSSMADAVRAAQERIDGRDPKPPEVIDDPDPEALEPSRVDPVDPAHGRG